MTKNTRALAALCIFDVLESGQSLSESLPRHSSKLKNAKDKAFLQEMAFGTLRHLRLLQHFLNQLLDKPLKAKYRKIELLLLVGLYQIKFMRTPTHAAVAETVSAVKELRKGELKGLVNAILRNFDRKPPTDEDIASLPMATQHSFPNWLFKRISQHYSGLEDKVLAQSNLRPPMWLRVNARQFNKNEYSNLLNKESLSHCLIDSHKNAVLLDKPTDVMNLPAFSDGGVSVQDGAAQLAAQFLEPAENERILDCCAAPGGKTCHIAELQPSLDSLVALDCDEQRLVRVSENLQRLQLDAEVVCADASTTDSWWDGKLFNKILLDAPCSATGVIRRHPDIKWLRNNTDIDALVEIQQQILNTMWSILKPGGVLLYATCSILPDENCDQIKSFLSCHDDAKLVSLDGQKEGDIGRQIFPGEDCMDGFYYAKIEKRL